MRYFLQDWRFWMILIFNSACLLYLWGLNAWLPTYLQTVRHFDLKSLGIFTSLPFILMFFGELLGGYISDRTGRRAMVCFIGLFFAGALIYVVALVSDSATAAIVMAVSAGFWGCALPPLFALAAQIIPPSVTASGRRSLQWDGQPDWRELAAADGLDHWQRRKLQCRFDGSRRRWRGWSLRHATAD